VSGEDLTGKSKLVRNVITSWLSYLVFLVAGFVMPHQIDGQLGPAELGLWDFCWTLVNYLSLSAIGIGSALNRYVAKYRAEQNIPALQQAVSTVICIQIGLSILVVLFAAIGSWYIPIHFVDAEIAAKTNLSAVIAWLGLALAFQFLFDTSRGIVTGVHRWDYFNALNASCYLVAVIGMLSALYLGYGIDVLAMIYAIMQLVQGIFRSVLARILCPEAVFNIKLVDRKFGLEIASFGLKSIVISITGLLAIQTTNILLMYKLGPVALAVFTRPIALVRHIENFLSRFTFILTPIAGTIESLEGRQKLKDFVVDSAKYGLAFSLPAVVLFAVFGHHIIELWMGASYVEEYLVAILALGFLLPMSQSAISRVLIGIDEHGPAALLSIVSLTIFYPVVWLLLKPTTTQDFALLAVVPLSLVNGVIVPIYACRRIGLSVFEYVSRAFTKVLAIGIPLSVSLAILAEMYSAGWLLSIFLGAIYLLAISALYYKFILPVTYQRQLVGFVRHWVLTVVSISGVDRALLRAYSNHIPILKLHGVIDESDTGRWQPTWDRHTAKQLDQVLAELDKRFNFISLDEAVDMLRGIRSMQRHCMVITFDDGYKNNIDIALPILKKYDCPFNLFVSTRFVSERQPFWIDRLDYALQQSTEADAKFQSDHIDFQFELGTREKLAESYKNFRRQSATEYEDDYLRNELISEFATRLEESSGKRLQDEFESDVWSQTVLVSDLQGMGDRDCIGAHTVNHVRLEGINTKQIDYELAESKQTIEEWTKKSCVHFCYPEGEYAAKHIEHVKAAGYLSACTSNVGVNKQGDDEFQLKRIPFPVGITGKEVRYHLLRNILLKPGSLFV
jgi:O-antigen/teichoic acid export membrane protein/peptidoglycan/xylan/chitin deacetylase (PgdA/CDA1 family)